MRLRTRWGAAGLADRGTSPEGSLSCCVWGVYPERTGELIEPCAAQRCQGAIEV